MFSSDLYDLTTRSPTSLAPAQDLTVAPSSSPPAEPMRSIDGDNPIEDIGLSSNEQGEMTAHGDVNKDEELKIGDFEDRKMEALPSHGVDERSNQHVDTSKKENEYEQETKDSVNEKLEILPPTHYEWGQ